MTQVFAEVVSDYQGGLPQDEGVKWVGLRPSQLQRRLQSRDYEISYYHIHQLLDAQGYRRRGYLKQASTKRVYQRNEQFEKIAALKHRFLDEGLPVLSIDTKHKELIGNFHRNGTYYSSMFRKVNDHDFRSQADAIMVPHGIYDLADNHGYLSLGISKDTSEFVCDNLEAWWQSDLQWKYPQAQWALILCDGGGSNNARSYIVKQDLYQLAQRLEINLLIAHYPAYCSKYNPIEHRFFSQLHQAWDGAVFHDLQIPLELAHETYTKTGLRAKARLNLKSYQINRTVLPEFRENLQHYVHFDQDIPKWNYYMKYQNPKVIF